MSLKKKAAELALEKAVPIARRPGKRGGDYRFDDKGQVSYESRSAPRASTFSHTGGFDSTEHQRQIDEHKFVETTHRAHVSRLKDKITAAHAQMKSAKPGQRAVLQRKLDKLISQHADHRKVAEAAKDVGIEATNQLAAAKKEHSERKQGVVQKQKQREAIMPIGTHAIRGEDEEPVAKERPVVQPRTTPSEPRTPETTTEAKPEEAPAKPKGTTSLWQPGDEKRRDWQKRENAATAAKPKTTEEWHQHDVQQAQQRQQSQQRLRQRMPQPQQAASPTQSQHAAHAAAQGIPQAKVQRPGLLTRLGGLMRRPQQTVTASFYRKNDLRKDTYADAQRGANNDLNDKGPNKPLVTPVSIKPDAAQTFAQHRPQPSRFGKPSEHAVNPPPEPSKGSASAGAKAMHETAPPAVSSGPSKITQTPTPEPVHAGSMQPAQPEKTAMAKPQVQKVTKGIGSGYGTFQKKEAHGTYHIESMPEQHTLTYTPNGGKPKSLGLHPKLQTAADAAASHSKAQGVQKAEISKSWARVEASPGAASKPPSYLPGVHSPNSPMRPGKKPKVKKCMTKKSETDQPQASSSNRRRRSSTAGQTVKMPPISNQEAAANLRAGIRKSDNKETAMSKNAMQDLFKSELGGANTDTDAITKCVHCNHDLSKSDLMKGLGTSFVADDNDNPSDGGKGQVEPSRGVPGAKENDEIAPMLKGLKGADKGNDEEFLITKGEMNVMGLDVSDYKDDAEDQHYVISKSELLRLGCEEHMPYIVNKKAFMMKSIGPTVQKAQPAVNDARTATDGPQMRTNPNGGLIQWVDTGEDARIAKSIEMSGGYGQGHDEAIQTQGRGH